MSITVGAWPCQSVVVVTQTCHDGSVASANSALNNNSDINSLASTMYICGNNVHDELAYDRDDAAGDAAAAAAAAAGEKEAAKNVTIAVAWGLGSNSHSKGRILCNPTRQPLYGIHSATADRGQPSMSTNHQ